MLMADVVVNELLNYSVYSLHRVTRSVLVDLLGNFYHEDELWAAKVALCDVMSGWDGPSDGWSKLVNNRGLPINRKGSDPSQKRTSDADDVVSMLLVLEANNVPLPKYVSYNLDREPGASFGWQLCTQACPGPAVSPDPSSGAAEPIQASLDVLTKSLEAVVYRLDAMEGRMSAPSKAALGNGQNEMSGAELEHDGVVTSDPDPSLDSQSLQASGDSVIALSDNDSVPSVTPRPHSVSRPVNQSEPKSATWADMAADLRVNDVGFQVIKRKSPRLGVKVSTCGIKAIPRPPACFVGRLDINTSEQDLHKYLTSLGMKGVYCRKLAAKDGKKYNTAAFKVTCSHESQELFYNEENWPAGAELRDWVYFNRPQNG